MTIVRSGLLAALVLIPALAGAADQPPADPLAADRPQRGITMATVQSRYGQPVTRHPAVGQPPITRWDYPSFAVFFEHDRVIHAVLVRSTPAG
ncbi:MAG: hypothetical protein FJ191_06390 [Gammaproteobacteria bacterium]|nr:hypothetical protein [Gammaproteobacteria bacterium]